MIAIVLLILWLLLQTCWMQNKVLPIALDRISEVLGTEIKAKSIDIDFFEELTLNHVFIQGTQGDTLANIDHLNVDISIFSLFNRTLYMDDVKISGGKIYLSDANGQSNYQHILDHLEKKNTKSSGQSSNSDSWNLGLDDIVLNDITIVQYDTNSKMIIDIQDLEADLTLFPEKFDSIAFDAINATGIEFSLIELQKSDKKQSVTSFPSLPILLEAKKINVHNARIVYDKSYLPRKSNGFDSNHIDISKTELSASNFKWGKDLSANIQNLSFVNHEEWQLNNLSTKLYASDTKIDMDQLSVVTESSEVVGDIGVGYPNFDALINDFTNQNIHLEIRKGKIDKNDTFYFINKDDISIVNLDQLSDINYSGLIKSNNGKYQFSKTDLTIGNRLALRGDVALNINSTLSYDARITNITTTQDYLQGLFPAIEIPDDLKNLGTINGTIHAKGNESEIEVKSTDLLLNDETKISGRGSITQLDKAPDVWIDLYFDQLFVNPNDILRGDRIPAEVYNLGQMDYAGAFIGNVSNISMDGHLKTDIGNIVADGSIRFNSDYSNGEYKGEFQLDGFDLGRLLQDDMYGEVTASGTINGEGFDINSLNTDMNVTGERLEYQGKVYEDVEVNGKYADHKFIGKITSNDEKLKVDFEGLADLNGAESEMEFNSVLEKIDLTQFGIGDSLFWVSGVISGKLKGNDVDNIVGNGTIQNLKIGTRHGVYISDSLVILTAKEIDESTKSYKIESSFIEGEALGNIKLSELPKVIEAYIKNYIPIAYGYEESEAIDTTIFDNQEFAINIKTKEINPLLNVILDDAIQLKNGYLKGNFSNEESKIDFKGSIDSLRYKGYVIEDGNYFFDGRQDFINGNIILENISNGKQILIHEANINSALNNKIATIDIELFDENDEQTLLIGSDISRTKDYVMNFHDTIIINQSVWEFSPYNEVTYGEYGLYMQDVSISKDKQAITAYTDENENGEAIEVLMDHFILSELTSIIGKENDYFEGEINGATIINNVWEKPFITADVELRDIMLRDYAVGTAKVEAIQNTKTNTVVTKVNLGGAENDARLELTYGIDNGSIAGYLDMTRLEITTLDPFLTDILTDSQGALVGRIDISGTPTKPKINGKVDLVEIQTTPVFTNSRYAILDQTVEVDEEAISFGDMIVVDKNNNIANVSGQILHTNLSEMYLDFNIDTDKFLFLNTTPAENPLFYGEVTVEANVSILGPVEDIKIEGSAKAIDNSKLAISPFSVESLDYENDLIIYADPRKISLDSLNAKASLVKNTFPFDLNMDLSIAEDSEFEMVMNPITGDNIKGRGIADLTFSLTKSGEMDLFGTYTVTDGKYLFTYAFISKEFDIQEGGTVVFNGDPLEGILDVSAIYEANTPVYDLLILELGDDFEDEKLIDAKRKRPINVVLTLAQSISKPEISMDIQQVQQDVKGNTEVYDYVTTKLAQLRNEPNELNKQVFGLLLFDNFILASSSGPNFTQTSTNIAFSSLSSLVTNQLNKLADGLIKGVELNFDVNSYSSDVISTGNSGLVTELGVGVSKKLFNDRLTLSAGTNVDLESSSTTALFNNLAGDFIIAYQLTEGGRFNIKVFRKSNYDTITDENSSKNGVGINIRKEFGTVKKKNQEND